MKDSFQSVEIFVCFHCISSEREHLQLMASATSSLSYEILFPSSSLLINGLCQLTRVAIYKRIPRCAANKDNKFLNDASCAIFDTKDIVLPTNLIFERGPKPIGPLM